jgi:hypothetical protein
MLWEGMVQEGLAIERAIDDRYTPLRRNPWNEIECGDHYSRSMASHGVYLAACGYEYHGPAAYLAFAPRLTPETFKCAFTTAQGWGSYTQQLTANSFKGTVAIKWGTLRVQELAFEMPDAFQPTVAKVLVNGKPLDAKLKVEHRRVRVQLASASTIDCGQSIEVALS